MDRALAAATRHGLLGEVIVGDTTHVLYDRVIGRNDGPTGTTLRPNALWRWASVSKQITATIVMQEVQARRFSLDSTLRAALPSFGGPTANRITIRELLQHDSGLPNPDDSPAGAAGVPQFYLRRTAAVGGVRDALGFCAGRPKTRPGAGFAYNNCDYIVLGAILEHATGKPFAQLVRERISEPAGLHSVGVFAAKTPDRPVTVHGVEADGSREPAINLATFGASGSLYGRPLDMLAFDRALWTNGFLTKKSMAALWSGDPHLGYVALGAWSFPAALRGCAQSVHLVERRGEIGGVQVRNLIAPDTRRALIVFTRTASVAFGEIWQGKGTEYELASAAFCQTRFAALPNRPSRY